MGGNLPYHQRSQQPPPSLQGTDFPPLSTAPEKKTPLASGAWTNASTTRSVLRAGPSGTTSAPAAGNALVHYPASGGNGRGPSPNNGRLDDMFERPPPKGNAELFNPKGGRPQAANGVGPPEKDVGSSTDTLLERVEGLSLAARGAEPVLTASPAASAPLADA